MQWLLVILCGSELLLLQESDRNLFVPRPGPELRHSEKLLLSTYKRKKRHINTQTGNCCIHYTIFSYEMKFCCGVCELTDEHVNVSWDMGRHGLCRDALGKDRKGGVGFIVMKEAGGRQNFVFFQLSSADLWSCGCHSALLPEALAGCRTVAHSAGCGRASPGSAAHTSHCSLLAV